MCNSALRSDLRHLDWTAGSFLVPVIGVCVGRRQGWGWGRGRRKIRHVAQAGLSAPAHNSYSNPVAFSNLCWRVYSSLIEHVKFKTISWHSSHQLGLHIAWKIWRQRPPRASLVAPMVKNPPAKQETWFYPWVGKIPWRRAWQPSPVLLPGESHGQRSLAGCSQQGHKESDMTEQLSTAEDPREGSPLPWKLNTMSFTGHQLISLSRLWAPRLTYRIVLIIHTLSPSPFSLWVVDLWCL